MACTGSSPEPTNMIQDDVTKLLNGELDEKSMSELTSKLSEEGRKALSEAIGLRKERNSTKEATDAEKAKLEEIRKEISDSEAKLKETHTATTQFREEQIALAKTKFFADKGIKPEEQSEYESMFKKLDSGKMTPELIYKDFARARAAIKADTFEETENKLAQLQKNAEGIILDEAGRPKTIIPSKEPPKFSDAAVKLANEAGITQEAAEKQIKEGNRRVREF